MGILDELVQSNRTPILFIGAGISKRYLRNYPSWPELLEESFLKINSDSFQYRKYIDDCNRRNLSDFETNIYMGTLIEDLFNKAFFDRKITLNIGNKRNPEWVKRGISPYKMYLATKFKKKTLNMDAELQIELDKLRKLKNKISAVITTNYDSFLEDKVFTEDYSVFVNQSDLFSPDSYGLAEIYKIHGSVTDANSIVITEDDYNNFDSSRKLIIAKMLILFSESPIIFLGYSFTDEDVRRIIEDFLSCLSKEQREGIRSHFVFISYKAGEQRLVEIERTITTVNNVEIPFVEIQTDNYSAVYDKLNEITPSISPKRVREVKRVIKTIVEQNAKNDEAESIIVGIDKLDDIDYASKPLAIAIGYKESILNTYGYGLLDVHQIYEDIIFDNKHFDPEAMCSERFKSIPINHLIPVFKYIKSIKLVSGSKLSLYADAHNSLDKIISKSAQKQIKNVQVFLNYEELMQYISGLGDCRKSAMAILKNISILSVDELRDLCKYLFKEFQAEVSTESNAKRCIMCLDLMENYVQQQ